MQNKLIVECAGPRAFSLSCMCSNLLCEECSQLDVTTDWSSKLS